jgi:hypothetical protein
MRQINLLPPELKPSKQAGILIKKAEKFFISLLLVYLFLMGAAFAYKQYLDKGLGEYKDKKSVLSNELKSLVNVETSTVFIRDRVGKYKTLSNRDIELTNLKLFESSHQYFASDSKITSIDISENNISYAASVTNLASFSRLLDSLVKSSLYKEVALIGLTRSEDGSYKFGLTMSF